MKKYIIGAFFGFLLAFTVSAHAAGVVSMIGKVIDGQFPVKVNGSTLVNQALVIEGTSYLPVREFAESLGMDVKFDASMGIELTQKTAPATQPVVSPSYTPNEPEKTTFKGLSAIVVNGQTYFSTTSYELKFDPYKWGYDSITQTVFLAETKKGTSEIVKKLVELNKNNPDDVTIYNGNSYVNVKYYQEH